MKRLLAIFVSLVLVLAPLSALAEIMIIDDEPSASVGDDLVVDGDQGEDTTESNLVRISSEEFGEFVVGATTKLNGDFFTNMWGNNTCDIDVRSMVHGLETIYWNMQSSFTPNLTVVEDMHTEYAENGDKTYTIKIYEDLLYNDGSPITARDYVFCLMLHGAPQITEIDGMTTNVGYIVGYEEFNDGSAPYFSGLRLIDDYTFTLTIKAEYLPFFYELGMLDATPYPIQVIAPGCEVVDNGEGATIENIDKSIEEPIFTGELLRETILDPETGYMSHPYLSSGPYMLTSFDWETRIATFKINPYFKGDWGGFKPTIDNVVFKSVLPVDMIQELEDGTVHLLNKVVYGDDIMAGLNVEGIRNTGYARLGFGFINFSTEMGPTQFEAVRKAVAYTLDVQEFVDSYNKGYGMPVYGYYGIGQWMVQMIYQAGAGAMDASDPEEDASDEAAEDESAMWAALSMDNFNTYEVDPDMALQLLIDDGWTLNEAGETFVDGTDEVRCKMVDGELMPLVLKWGKMKDSVAADILEEMIVEPLTALGMKIEITEVPFVELLEHYYRQRERTYDIMYLATNFISIFDPYFVFNTRDEYQGHQNTTGYRDAALEALALNLRRTEPGALLEYCQKWMAFQTYFNEKLPMLPIYGNVYFDFYTPYLQEYHPDWEEMKNWPTALVRSYLAEPVEVGGDITVAGTEDLAAAVDESVSPDHTFATADGTEPFQVSPGNWIVGQNIPAGSYVIRPVGDDAALFNVPAETNGGNGYDAIVGATVMQLAVELQDGAEIQISEGSLLFERG